METTGLNSNPFGKYLLLNVGQNSCDKPSKCAQLNSSVYKRMKISHYSLVKPCTFNEIGIIYVTVYKWKTQKNKHSSTISDYFIIQHTNKELSFRWVVLHLVNCLSYIINGSRNDFIYRWHSLCIKYVYVCCLYVAKNELPICRTHFILSNMKIELVTPRKLSLQKLKKKEHRGLCATVFSMNDS